MADLYGIPTSSAPESEDFSSFLNQLFHNSSSVYPSSSSSPSCMSLRSKFTHLFHSQSPGQSPPVFSQIGEQWVSPEDRVRLTARSSASGMGFSDPSGYLMADVKQTADHNAFSSAGVADFSVANTSSKETRRIWSGNDLGDFSGDSENEFEVSEMPSLPIPPRSSTKRRRAAEIHNLSEKRRRSKINEKMKALQELIPNSNKTDKASMLDEAIEYLKQLQLQLQMLSLRNGLSLFPMCVPDGVLQSLPFHQMGMAFDLGTLFPALSRGVGPSNDTIECPVQSTFNSSNKSTPPNQPICELQATNINTSETLFGLWPLVDSGRFNVPASSKESRKEGSPQQHLDG